MNGKLNFRKRRAVSEIIATLLILGVTVAGAVLITNAMDSLTLPSSSRGTASEVHPESVSLIGYDTRDSTNLSGVTGLDNNYTESNPSLVTVSAIEVDKIPSQDGTEFIVLHLRNLSTNSIFLHNVLINNVKHSWDTDAATQVLDPTFTGVTTGQFPADGKFSIIPIYNGAGPPITQLGTNEMVGDEEVRVIVKLSGNILQDIEMWDAVRIQVNYGGVQPTEYIILSGDAKW
jgi:flagellin-like protein